MAKVYVITIGYISWNKRTEQYTSLIKNKTQYCDTRIECEQFLEYWDTGMRKIIWSTVGFFEHDLDVFLNEIITSG